VFRRSSPISGSAAASVDGIFNSLGFFIVSLKYFNILKAMLEEIHKSFQK
jgi:hypothetical protein